MASRISLPGPRSQQESGLRSAAILITSVLQDAFVIRGLSSALFYGEKTETEWPSDVSGVTHTTRMTIASQRLPQTVGATRWQSKGTMSQTSLTVTYPQGGYFPENATAYDQPAMAEAKPHRLCYLPEELASLQKLQAALDRKGGSRVDGG